MMETVIAICHLYMSFSYIRCWSSIGQPTIDIISCWSSIGQPTSTLGTLQLYHINWCFIIRVLPVIIYNIAFRIKIILLLKQLVDLIIKLVLSFVLVLCMTIIAKILCCTCVVILDCL